MFILKKYINQKGQVLVLTVILLPLLLIMSILITETGFLYIKQSQLQNAADAIAVSGITVEDAAKKIVALNRTLDFVKSNLKIIECENGTVSLKEDVVPIFGKIFGNEVITTIEVHAKN